VTVIHVLLPVQYISYVVVLACVLSCILSASIKRILSDTHEDLMLFYVVQRKQFEIITTKNCKIKP